MHAASARRLKHLSILFTIIITSLLARSPARAADARAKVELAKAATALVVVDDVGTGTAFCIRSDGIFVTNAHVVGVAAGGDVKLVLRAGEKGQELLDARIMSVDPEADLALLKLKKPEPGLAPLPLGDDDALFETMPLMAAGFPFGEMLALDEAGYPSVSISTGRVTSIRRKGGELELLQFDAQVHPGNSGGPVLDENGKVVGVTVAKMLFTQVNFAIPVSRLREFLKQPGLIVSGPTHLSYSKRAQSFDVGVEVFELDPAANAAVEIEAEFPQAGVPVTVKARRSDGAWKITRPAQPATGSAMLAIEAIVAGKALRGTTADQSLKLGSRQVPLSDVREIRRTGKHYAVALAGGEKFAIDGPEAKLTIQGSEGSVEVPLADATCVSVGSYERLDSTITYTVNARRNGKVITKLEHEVPVIGAPPVIRGVPVRPGEPDRLIIDVWVAGTMELHITPEGLYWKNRAKNIHTPDSSKINNQPWKHRWHDEYEENVQTTEPLRMEIGTPDFQVLWSKCAQTWPRGRMAERGWVELNDAGDEQILTIHDSPEDGKWYYIILARRSVVPPIVEVPVEPADPTASQVLNELRASGETQYVMDMSKLDLVGQYAATEGMVEKTGVKGGEMAGSISPTVAVAPARVDKATLVDIALPALPSGDYIAVCRFVQLEASASGCVSLSAGSDPKSPIQSRLVPQRNDLLDQWRSAGLLFNVPDDLTGGYLRVSRKDPGVAIDRIFLFRAHWKKGLK